MEKVKIKKEVIEFFENSGEEYASGDDDGKGYSEFIHYPFWLKKTEDPEIFELYRGVDLPEWVKEELNEFGELKREEDE